MAANVRSIYHLHVGLYGESITRVFVDERL